MQRTGTTRCRMTRPFWPVSHTVMRRKAKSTYVMRYVTVWLNIGFTAFRWQGCSCKSMISFSFRKANLSAKTIASLSIGYELLLCELERETIYKTLAIKRTDDASRKFHEISLGGYRTRDLRFPGEVHPSKLQMHNFFAISMVLKHFELTNVFLTLLLPLPTKSGRWKF